jgi:hypothetical protein
MDFDQERAEIETESTIIVTQAQNLIIVSDDDYASAGNMLTMIKRTRSKIAEYMQPIIDAAHHAHKTALGQRKKLEKPLVDAESRLKSSMAEYFLKKERERETEEKRLAEEARKMEEEQLLARAEAAEAAGNKEEAEAILNEQITTPTVKLGKSTPTSDGIHHRTTWAAEVVDFHALVFWVCGHKDMLNLLLPNQTALNQMAKAQKEAMAIPGVKAVPTTTTVAKTS